MKKAGNIGHNHYQNMQFSWKAKIALLMMTSD